MFKIIKTNIAPFVKYKHKIPNSVKSTDFGALRPLKIVFKVKQ